MRDCVLIRSSKKNENPYIAKISSIWQESGGVIMMTVFWYYRPEDTTKPIQDLFHEVFQIISTVYYCHANKMCD